MLDKVMNQEELKFLRLLGIDKRNGNLYNVSTGENFVRIKDESRWNHYIFKCKDIELSFFYADRPVYVSVKKDGMVYRYNPHYNENRELNEGIELEINPEDNDKSRSLIRVFPEYNKYFIKTVIKPTNSMIDTFGLDCGFSHMLVWTFEGSRRYSGFSKEAYQSYMKSIIKNNFDDKEQCDAYLSCMPIIMEQFESMLDFPLRNYEEFEKYYQRIEDSANISLANRVDENHQYLLYREKEFNEKNKDRDPGSILFDQAKESFEQLQEFYMRTVKYINKRNSEIKKNREEKEEFEKYIEGLRENTKKSRTR